MKKLTLLLLLICSISFGQRKEVVQRSDQNQAFINAIENYSKIVFDNQIELYKSFDYDLGKLSDRIDALEVDNANLKLEVERLNNELLLANKRIDSIVDNDNGTVEPPKEVFYGAFPTAYGAGSNVSGGRGKPVYFVTNLNNSGSGSFRQALNDTKTSNGGIIVFNVSGTINLTSDLFFANQDNISILGQTAPIGGIAITGNRLRFQNVNNLIIRYVRFRPNFAPSPTTQKDVLEIFDSSDYIIDHCSLAWGTDEIVNSGNGTNYTWQNNLIAESNGTGAIIGALSDMDSEMSFLRNVFYNCSHRFPNWVTNSRVDIINNIAWNFRGQISVPSGAFKVNHIGNHYTYFTFNNVSNKNKGVMYNHLGGDFPSIYTSMNYVNDILTDMDADNWVFWRWRWNPTGTQYSGAGNESALTRDFQLDEPFALLGNPIDVMDANTAFDVVVDNVGANKVIDNNGKVVQDIDGVDAVYLDRLKNRILVSYEQTNVFNTSHRNAYISSITNTPMNTRPPSYDINKNGVCDKWENDNIPSGKKETDVSPSGYTYRELFWNTVDE